MVGQQAGRVCLHIRILHVSLYVHTRSVLIYVALYYRKRWEKYASTEKHEIEGIESVWERREHARQTSMPFRLSLKLGSPPPLPNSASSSWLLMQSAGSVVLERVSADTSSSRKTHSRTGPGVRRVADVVMSFSFCGLRPDLNTPRSKWIGSSRGVTGGSSGTNSLPGDASILFIFSYSQQCVRESAL